MDAYYSLVEKNIGYYQKEVNGFRPFNGGNTQDSQWLAQQQYSCTDQCERDRFCGMLTCPAFKDACGQACAQRCHFQEEGEKTMAPRGFASAVDWRGQSVLYPILPIPGLQWNQPSSTSAASSS